MKIIAWNCQGLAQPKAVRALKQLLSSSSPDLLFLSEVKTSSTHSISKALSSCSLVNQVFVPPVGLAGGLCLAWTSNLSVNITLQNNFLINAFVSCDPSLPFWQFTGIYCPCSSLGKQTFWNLLHSIHDVTDGPWLLMGDFNSVLSQSEKK
ncbi:hypothetical protein ACP275_09G098200 [Erythranthe tilingii]